MEFCRRIRDWFYERFLPWVTREQYQHEMNMLRTMCDALKTENKELKAYIQGMQDANRNRRITINNEVHKE